MKLGLGIEGRRAAVAAASTGLGLAVAKALGSEGARVAMCGRDEGRIHAAAAQVGGDAVPIVADVSTAAGAAEFVRRASAELSGVDILIANGGGPPAGTFDSTSLEQYHTALESNLVSVVAMAKVAVPPMRAAGWGRILAITSISVRQPIPILILSNTTRAGVTGFLKTLSREVAGDGVTVNSLQPGLHATDRVKAVYGELLEHEVGLIPARTLGRPEDFGSVAAFLCSDHARFITGAAIPLDGGAYAGLM